MRRALCLALLASLVGASGCAYRIVRAGELDRARFEDIRERLSRTRGLAFLRPVPVSVVRSSEVRSYLREELGREMPPEELRNLTRVYSRLKLLDPDDDLEGAVLDLYQDQVAGFYDPRKQSLFLVADALRGQFAIRVASALLRRDLAGEMFLAHELTHALQDQHFEIGRYLKDVKQDDRSLARRAVYEGDATLSGFATLAGGLEQGMLDKIVGKLREVPEELEQRYPDTPLVLRAAVAFQYVEGTEMAAEAYRRAGWPGVNALVENPPASTEQVMHIEKYFASEDPPVEIDLGGVALGGGGWRVVEQNTMGELIVLTLLKRHLSAEKAATAAAGWGGDKLVASQRGESMRLVWLSNWDTSHDAAEFFSALTAVMGLHCEEAVGEGGGSEAGCVSPDGSSYLEKRKRQVLLVDQMPPDDPAQIARTVWKMATADPPSPATGR